MAGEKKSKESVFCIDLRLNGIRKVVDDNKKNIKWEDEGKAWKALRKVRLHDEEDLLFFINGPRGLCSEL
jgi:hypothetical protein